LRDAINQSIDQSIMFISTTNNNNKKQHKGPIPYRPQTTSATTISATNHIGHNHIGHNTWILSYGAFACIPVVPGARCSARL